MDNSNNEQALIRVLRAIIHAEINDRIDQITEAHHEEWDAYKYRTDIEDIICDYIDNNVTIQVG